MSETQAQEQVIEAIAYGLDADIIWDGSNKARISFVHVSVDYSRVYVRFTRFGQVNFAEFSTSTPTRAITEYIRAAAGL